jgi:tetratricopeptide (TPR) repeat protein
MYALLRRQVYNDPADAPQAEQAERAILSYYHTQLEGCRHDLDELYAPVEREGRDRLDLARIAEVHTRRQTLLTEIVYYRLRQDAIRGFQRYYRYTREAALSADTALDVQLQAEMLAFLAERDPERRALEIDGLERNLAIWVVALRPVVRAFASQKYNKVLEEAERLRQQGADILAAGLPTTEAALSTWEAGALTYLGDAEGLQLAREKLDQAVTAMEQLTARGSSGSISLEARVWRARAVLAFASRVRAYLQWTRGFIQGAAEDYRRAAALWREVNLRVERASSLNDLGFAMAELGHWSDARALVEDALELRRALGPRSPVALSLNTLGLIDLREGAYTSAIQRSESALLLFRALGNQRGIGLALIGLAEAQRRYSGTSLVPVPDEKVRLLREARDHAREAVLIFDKLGERLRHVEALIEEGCACRDWVEVRHSHSSPRDNVERLIAEGAEALRSAADMAGDSIRYKRVDALVNLTWLGFFAHRDELVESAAAEAEAAIPRDYRIDKQTGLPGIAREQAQVLLWPQLGKLHTLYGHRALDRYTSVDTGTETRRFHTILQEVVDNYLWSLQYSAQYSEDYRDMRRTREEIYERLKTLDFDQLRIVSDRVRQVEEEYHLDQSQMQRFLRHRALWYDR